MTITGRPTEAFACSPIVKTKGGVPRRVVVFDNHPKRGKAMSIDTMIAIAQIAAVLLAVLGGTVAYGFFAAIRAMSEPFG